MEILYPRCCGLDVHKQTVVACVIIPRNREIRTFSTMTGDLLKLKAWLIECEVTHVAMESTGVYWKPVYNVLEEGFTLLLAMRGILKLCQVGRQMCRMLNGSRICSGMVCLRAVLSLTASIGNCVN